MRPDCSPLAAADLSPEDRVRFLRHILLPEIGPAGQARLRSARVLVVGAGGLGSSALLHLAASGVGRIGIVDPDRVALDNLHRQILHGTANLGTPKVESARRRLTDIDPQTDLDLYPAAFAESNADTLASIYELIVDGTDNFPARRLINRMCIRHGIPMVYGSAQRFEGQVSVFDARRGPCYSCVFPGLTESAAVESPAETGVFGPIPGIVGALQALEALKVILGTGELLIGRLLVFDGLACGFSEVQIQKKPACPECGGNSNDL
jgi:molybdopterin/thiamine biosynthesis adenylyltransferase